MSGQYTVTDADGREVGTLTLSGAVRAEADSRFVHLAKAAARLGAVEWSGRDFALVWFEGYGGEAEIRVGTTDAEDPGASMVDADADCLTPTADLLVELARDVPFTTEYPHLFLPGPAVMGEFDLALALTPAGSDALRAWLDNETGDPA